MIKLLLTLVMMFAFGTSTVNAEENTTSIKDRISELTETSSDSESSIKAEVNELSEDELKAIIANVDELTEPNENDLVIKEAATNKLEEMEEAEENVPNADNSSIELTTDSNVETSNLLVVGVGALGISLMLSALTLLLAGYSYERITLAFIVGALLVMGVKLFTKL